ncbi:MAG: hypothetical protein Q7S91_00275 [Aquabacterium sp.]|nr:hypothetical protein [Aquabacterium sp.]
MDPRTLFPVLSLAFVVAALWHRVHRGHWRGAGRTWLLLAAVFGAVASWLHMQP